MNDDKIIELYLARNEQAIYETDLKYGSLCRAVAHNILHDEGDSEECVSDTYLRVWNVIPPQRPKYFRAFLTKITRNIALNRYKAYNTDKRMGSKYAAALDELSECIPSSQTVEKTVEDRLIIDVIERFLASLTREKRVIFMKRYWLMCPIAEIACDMGISESKVKMTLFRTRERLRELLAKEGIYE